MTRYFGAVLFAAGAAVIVDYVIMPGDLWHLIVAFLAVARGITRIMESFQ